MSPDAMRCGTLHRSQIMAMRADGLSVDDIAAQAGVARSTMYNAISLWGVPRQRGGDRRSGCWRLLFREQLANALTGGAA